MVASGLFLNFFSAANTFERNRKANDHFKTDLIESCSNAIGSTIGRWKFYRKSDVNVFGAYFIGSSIDLSSGKQCARFNAIIFIELHSQIQFGSVRKRTKHENCDKQYERDTIISFVS